MGQLKLLAPYFVERRPLIIIGLSCLITVDFFQLLIPRVIKRAVDDLTAYSATVPQLLTYASWILVLGCLIATLRYVWRRCLLGTSRRVEEGLRNRLFTHLQTLSAAYFDRTATGDLMAHATNDIQQIRMATGMGMVALNDAIFLGAAAIGFMLYIHVGLTLLVLIPAPLIILGTRILSKHMHQGYQGVQHAFSDLTEVIRERFAGIRILKAYSLEESSVKQVEQVSKAYISQNLKLAKVLGSFHPLMILLTNLGLAIVLYFGGRQTIFLTITPGDFVAFLSYLGLITWPMMALGWVTNLVQRGRASLDRIEAIMDVRPEITDSPEAIPVPLLQGEITYHHVSFSHPGSGNGTRQLLRDISFSQTPGTILGIVGPPGSGKTTLLNLLPRLYDVTAGHILVDGMDIRSLKLAQLRKQMAFLPQEPFLFAGTIKENIAFNHPDISENDLIQAARDAQIYDTIMGFSEGFDTVVGERGILLSGGQKQRIALARCLLRKAPIIIMDDPISQVDTATGAKIINTLKELTGKTTLLIVSHRLSAVRYADQIITLDNGRVAEMGNHAQLMETNRYYANTVRLQELEEARHEA